MWRRLAVAILLFGQIRSTSEAVRDHDQEAWDHEWAYVMRELCWSDGNYLSLLPPDLKVVVCRPPAPPGPNEYPDGF